MRIFFSVGEPSGDVHGANLVRQLREQHSGVDCVGYGGPRMREAGCNLHEDLTQLAVMWFLRVIWNIRRFHTLYRRADSYFRDERPDAVVLIDYPGFNWWIARAAKRHDIPVFYYGAPQLWAWAEWRIHKMRRLIDHVLCKLPFEERWYRERQCHATFVGHPFFDETERHLLDAEFMLQQSCRGGQLVTILPGSRTQEVLGNLPSFLKSAELISDRLPNTRFAVAAFNDKQAVLAEQMVAQSGVSADVFTGRTPELIKLADCCLACSGSVSLELMYHEKPTVIHYKISRLAHWVQNRFRRVKYITLVNLLFADELVRDELTTYDPDAEDAELLPFPEYLTCQDKSLEMADYVVRWLSQPETLAGRVAMLHELKRQHAGAGASSRAARYILAELATGRDELRPPHFLSAETVSSRASQRAG